MKYCYTGVASAI